MSTLYVDRKDAELGFESGAILLHAGGERLASVPLAQVERVVVRGSARLSTRLLAELWRNGSGLLVLSGRRNEATARLLGRPHGEAALRLAQYATWADETTRTRLARQIVLAKLHAQSRMLRDALQGRPDQRLALCRALDRLHSLQNRLASIDPLSAEQLLGLEGAAAAAGFEAYVHLFAPALGFAGRRRRPPPDPVNACLSLGYTLIQFDAARECQLAGLDPMIGLYHAPSPGRPSLACDLAEPLRPHVEIWVWHLFRDRTLRPEHFQKVDGACLLGKQGRHHFYTAFESFAAPCRRLLRRYCRRLVRELRAGQTSGHQT